MDNEQTAILFKDKKYGFFIYLFVEAIMFATLFATYIIFTPPEEGPTPANVFKWKNVILLSLFLLPSSLTLMISEKALKYNQPERLVTGLVLTLLLGLTFFFMEANEFYTYMVHDGYLMSTSNFFASYYVLVGLHAAHVGFGCFWMILLLIQYHMKIPRTLYEEKQRIFQYYWHFVDVIWLFIVMIVYLPYLID
ncbi:cytochrome c oxidase subunit 3 [Virgibacillus kekensis]|uniref:Cytochrome c oxidase subunit 3 n=1 Tax=Virgibacillus kekensis TaxID=202261 RepID=A0ABV9DH21_9BACI